MGPGIRNAWPRWARRASEAGKKKDFYLANSGSDIRAEEGDDLGTQMRVSSACR